MDRILLPAPASTEQRLKTPDGWLAIPAGLAPAGIASVRLPPGLVAALLPAARAAATLAHAPYSRFRVGAALVMADDPDAQVIPGCNVENASYGATLCAERVAITGAVSRGFRRLGVIAVSCVATLDAPVADRSPCGICRQVVQEFATPDSLVLIDRAAASPDEPLADLLTVSQLLPLGFSLG